MTSIIPTKIDKCWKFSDSADPEVTVKACSINFVNPRTGVEARCVVKSRFSGSGPSIFDGSFVKECSPVKEGGCALNVNGAFYKDCDPKKDKKCKIALSDLMFPPR